MNRKISRICGRNTSTPPTPAITPSPTSEVTHSGAATASSPRAAQSPIQPTSDSVSPVRNVPGAPNVTANISPITTRKIGNARYLFVTTRSILSEVEISRSRRR